MCVKISLIERVTIYSRQNNLATLRRTIKEANSRRTILGCVELRCSALAQNSQQRDKKCSFHTPRFSTKLQNIPKKYKKIRRRATADFSYRSKSVKSLYAFFFDFFACVISKFTHCNFRFFNFTTGGLSDFFATLQH